MIAAVIDHIPRAVHIYFSEPISIIPFPDCIVFLLHPIVRKHLLYFWVCKPKILIKRDFGDWKYFKIVETCKNAFLGNSETACENGEFQTAVCFQSIFKEVTNQQCHLIIISPGIRFCQWNIIFIDQNNNFFFIIIFKQF